jgi:hypothetical protein
MTDEEEIGLVRDKFLGCDFFSEDIPIILHAHPNQEFSLKMEVIYKKNHLGNYIEIRRGGMILND